MKRLSIFSLIAVIALLFFGVGFDSTAQVPNFAPCSLIASTPSNSSISTQSISQNSATFSTNGVAGNDVGCPYIITIFVGGSPSVSPTNYAQSVDAGNLSNPGKFNYSGIQVSGLSSNTQYYAISCVMGANSQHICSSSQSFTTSSIPSTPSSNSSGSSGGMYQLVPVVGKVTVVNNPNGSINAIAYIESVGCPAQVWFEYGKGGINSKTPFAYIQPTLQTGITSNITNITSGTYSIRAVAQNCKGKTVGPIFVFNTAGYNGPVVNTNYTAPTQYTNNYYNPGYSTIPKYNSYATDSTRHSRAGYWESNDAYNDAANKNYGYYKTVATHYKSNTDVYSQNYNYSNGIYSQNLGYNYTNGQQPYPYNYYRGNGGDLRVWDRPYDIVAYSNFIRGGVARVYTTSQSAYSPAFVIGGLILISIIAIAGYRLGRDTRGY